MNPVRPAKKRPGAPDEPRRFDPPLLFDVLPDGSVAYCDSAGYSIKLVAGDGAPIGTIARPLTPEPVTTEVETTVRDSAMAEFERLYGDPDNPQGPDRAPPEFMAQMVAQMRADIKGMQSRLLFGSSLSGGESSWCAAAPRESLSIGIVMPPPTPSRILGRWSSCFGATWLWNCLRATTPWQVCEASRGERCGTVYARLST